MPGYEHYEQLAKSKNDLECLKTAISYRQDYLMRVNEGTYYEE